MFSKEWVTVYAGDELKKYDFGDDHPWGEGRMSAFWEEMLAQELVDEVTIAPPVKANEDDLLTFHTPEYVALVKESSKIGTGYLDDGDTPAFPGIFDATLYPVGTTLDAVRKICNRQTRRAFVPIAGLHHARRDRASGFCVFNDIGIAIELILHRYKLNSVAYIDIDAHHGDGVFYAYEEDAKVYCVDIHEDGKYLFPGTGDAVEQGKGDAKGTKLNIPMQPGADDTDFKNAWEIVESFLYKMSPDFIILQTGADALADDPMSHLNYSYRTYYYAAERLCIMAEDCCDGRIVVLGGGGYSHKHTAKAWAGVIHAMLRVPYGRTTSLLA